MTQRMVKGSNLPLDAHGVRAVLRWSPGPGAPDVDASMLLVGPDGRVRSDADFVFYNEPRHPSGLARHLPKKRVPDGLTDTVEVDLAKLDASVDRVVIAASCDGGPFRLVRDLGLSLYESTGPAHAAPLITFEVVPDTGEETALICGELYRKDAGWKFRALGQGYTSGLVGLATEFGIAVDDVDGMDGTDGTDGMDGASGGSVAGPDSAGGARPGGGAEAPDSGAASGRTAPHHPPFPAAPPPPAAGPVPAAAYGYPLPPPQPGHVPAQPAYGYPQPVTPPAPPPVHQQPQQGWPAYGYPQPVAATVPAPVPAPVPQAEPALVLPPQGPQFQPGR